MWCCIPSLTPEQLEAVIIRTGWRHGADYEIAHHVMRGRKAGLSGERLAAQCSRARIEHAQDRLMAAAVDDLAEGAALAPETAADVGRLAGVAGMLDLIATFGLYSVLAGIAKSFATPLDADIAAELSARPHPAFRQSR